LKTTYEHVISYFHKFFQIISQVIILNRDHDN